MELLIGMRKILVGSLTFLCYLSCVDRGSIYLPNANEIELFNKVNEDFHDFFKVEPDSNIRTYFKVHLKSDNILCKRQLTTTDTGMLHDETYSKLDQIFNIITENNKSKSYTYMNVYCPNRKFIFRQFQSNLYGKRLVGEEYVGYW